MKRRLIKLMADVRGATAIEYGLIVSLIVIAIVVGISALGSSNGGAWGNLSNKVDNALPSS
jgi:pilus assembly protein Flp/PilA